MSKNITDYVMSCVDDFNDFVGIHDFPPFNVKTKDITLIKSLNQGYDSPAAAIYDVSTGCHTLEIWPELSRPQMNAEYLVFHELTHIWDAETFSECDKKKHASNKGYTEYHAAQIDFMKILGASNIMDSFSFSMKQSVQTYACTCSKTAKDFLAMPLNLAVSLISRDDFPANIETFATTMGLIFNYYGRQSICKMYANDYVDEEDLSVIAGFIGEDSVRALDEFMIGWLNADKILYLNDFYLIMVTALIQRKKLL